MKLERMKGLLKKPKEQVPRRLKPARDDNKIKNLDAGLKAALSAQGRIHQFWNRAKKIGDSSGSRRPVGR